MSVAGKVSPFSTSPSILPLGLEVMIDMPWRWLIDMPLGIETDTHASQQCLLPLPSSALELRMARVNVPHLLMVQFLYMVPLRSQHQATLCLSFKFHGTNSFMGLDTLSWFIGVTILPYYKSFDPLQRADCTENYQEHFQITTGCDSHSFLLSKCWASLQLFPN